MAEPDALFADPRLARLYDPLEDDREDLDPYLRLATEFGARSVIDVGCGTGEFAVRLARLADDRGVAMSIIGVDPAAASIDIALHKPLAERVRWMVGTASDLANGHRPVRDADLIVMTGNVAQVFVTDDAWSETLDACRQMLAADGRLVVETRDPERRAWEEWSGDGRRSVNEVPGVGRVESWIDVVGVDLPLVTFDSWFRFEETGDTVSSTSTLRFRDREEIGRTLNEAGLVVDEIRDAPDRPGREFVVIASPS